MKVVILGCGRSGATLAISLAKGGHEVSVIDLSPRAMRRLADSPTGRRVIGNGLDLDTLEQAGIKEADAFFALTRGDNTNLMAAQVVQRQYQVPQVMVKVADADRAKAYRKLGLNCLNASAILAGVCEDWMTGAELKPVNDYAAFEAKPREN